MGTSQSLVDFSLSAEEEEEVLKLAAAGLAPDVIAAALKWPLERRMRFSLLAKAPGSKVAALITSGRAIGIAVPQKKLIDAAESGNVDAAKAIRQIQEKNRFKELLTNMDQDEFAG